MSYAAYFDGINDYVDLGDLGVCEDKTGAVIGWLYLPDVVGDHVVFSEYNSAGAHYVTLSVSGSALTATAHDGTNTTSLTGGTLTAQTWHHVALVADGTDLLLYLDGALVDSDTLPALSLTLDTTVLGRNEAGTDYLFGALADVRLYVSAPSAASIADDYAYGLPLPDLDLALWPTTIDELVTQPAQTVVVTCTAYLSGEEVATLDVVGGSVTADARRSQLRDGSVEIAPSADLSLEEAYDLLATPGLELALARGFRLPDGSEVTAALGRFIVDEVEWQAAAAGEQLSATLSDLSARIARARWTEPYQIASGTALADALNGILFDRWADAQTTISASNCPDTLTAGCVFEAGSESDPWADACALATAHGYVLYFDATGAAAVTVVPDPASVEARFTFSRGATAIVTEETRAVPMERIRNGVIATGEGTELDVPVRGEAWDTDPASPTYRYGPFGQVPRFYSSPLLTTDAMCETAAESILRSMIGRSETLEWQHVVHPGLQPLDVVALEDAEGALHRYVLDAVTVPLDVGSTMRAKARDTLVED